MKKAQHDEDTKNIGATKTFSIAMLTQEKTEARQGAVALISIPQTPQKNVHRKYLKTIWYRNHQHQLGLLAHSNSFRRSTGLLVVHPLLVSLNFIRSFSSFIKLLKQQ